VPQVWAPTSPVDEEGREGEDGMDGEEGLRQPDDGEEMDGQEGAGDQVHGYPAIPLMPPPQQPPAAQPIHQPLPPAAIPQAMPQGRGVPANWGPEGVRAPDGWALTPMSGEWAAALADEEWDNEVWVEHQEASRKREWETTMWDQQSKQDKEAWLAGRRREGIRRQEEHERREVQEMADMLRVAGDLERDIQAGEMGLDLRFGLERHIEDLRIRRYQQGDRARQRAAWRRDHPRPQPVPPPMPPNLQRQALLAPVPPPPLPPLPPMLIALPAGPVQPVPPPVNPQAPRPPATSGPLPRRRPRAQDPFADQDRLQPQPNSAVRQNGQAPRRPTQAQRRRARVWWLRGLAPGDTH
jgi:hypothetical protein